MISSAEILRTHAFLARRFRWRRPVVVSGIEEALREAEALAAGRREAEPAALLLALLRRPMDLGDAWEQLPLVLVENLARRVGTELRLDPTDLEIHPLRMRVIARLPSDRATFEDVRAFLIARAQQR